MCSTDGADGSADRHGHEGG
ncbi:hypothetical protein KL937_003901, partial [Ogataea polymorpha]